MLNLFRNTFAARVLTTVLLWCFVTQLIFFERVYATGGGPTTPEATSFTPASATNMVDPFTGAFSYNIPLLSVDGYPINIAYSGNPTMEQEASWVGLGWNINPGAINRQMRGMLRAHQSLGIGSSIVLCCLLYETHFDF